MEATPGDVEAQAGAVEAHPEAVDHPGAMEAHPKAVEGPNNKQCPLLSIQNWAFKPNFNQLTLLSRVNRV